MPHPDPSLIMSIRSTITSCTLCPLHESTSPVPWSGDPLCDIAVIGEAPGQTEEQDGLPFVGTSGQLLRQLLRNVGIDDKKVAYVNSVSCRPERNRTPNLSEINACRPNMRLQLALLQPRYVILAGTVALQSVRGHNKWPTLELIHGKPFKWHNPPAPCDPVAVWPTYHPASGLKPQSKYRRIIEQDLAAFVEWRAAEEAGTEWPSFCVICGDAMNNWNEWGQALCGRHAARQGVLWPEDQLTV